MSVSETSSTVMIELLSLGQGPNGYEIEVGLTDGNGYHTRILELDEYTYSQLNALGPFDSDRVRLSLYPKWDPFRNIYFSTLIRMKSTFNETLYFACSQYYVSQLNQLRAIERIDQAEETVPELLQMPFQRERISSVADYVKSRAKSLVKRRIGPVVLLALVCILLLLSPLREDRALSVKNEEALEHSEITEQPKASFPVPALPDPNNASNNAPLPPSTEPEVPPQASQKPQKQALPIEEVVIDKGKYTSKLPKGYVALSFDDGPSKYTQEIVDILVEHGVAATFLFIGKNVVHHPDEARYALAKGMTIGNHSWDHSKLTANSEAVNKANLMKANQALQKITGAPISLFRPPYGAIDAKVSRKVTEQQMKVLMWNRDTEDWRKKAPEDLIQYFHNVDPSGAIFLLHEKKITVEALPEIIEYLIAKDLKFVIFK
ncbi:polysaccharide deacetylase family protein [Paenibacillus sp. GCM10012306]|uniref:polysaccharide deacetylase family protein n=1 Tax=Paenibacillus sp. GCM10012306 TaxID=3317342 RepID=UPI00361B1735